MGSWSENSSYQGAASGAAAGSTIAPGWGTAIGAAVGFVAGGLMGGASEDSAKAAEAERLKEIQKAIDRQNTSDFKAKSQAEQWALSDIGINKDDQVQDARANTAGIKKDIKRADAAVGATSAHARQNDSGNFENLTDLMNWTRSQQDTRNPHNRVSAATFNAQQGRMALAANQGIIANYDEEMSAPPKKY
jgi:hypothetical protein